MSTDLSGVGQPGFVARYGLAGPGREAAAEEVAARIRELDLRTVRLAIVDQHGIPRGKMLSPEAADRRDVRRPRLLRRHLQPGHRKPGVRARVRSRRRVRHRGVHRVPRRGGGARPGHLPGAAVGRTGPAGCCASVYFGNGQPMPLDGRGLLRRMLADLADAGYDYLAGLEVEFSIVIRSPEQLTPENAGFTPPPPPVSVFERGYQFLSEVRLDSMGDTLEVLRDALFDVGLPPRSIEDEWGPGPARVQLRTHRRAGRGRRGGAVPVGGQAGLPAARAAGHVHVPARAAELLLLRLAPAPVAAVPRGRLERVRQRRRAAVCPRRGSMSPGCWSTPRR